MQIIHHLTFDLARQLPVPPIGAVQSDANTRAVEISLLENGELWNVPEGVTAAVAFRKPDKTKGLYDRLSDGSAAVTVSGSTVTAILAPQVLSCAGEVSIAIVFHDTDLNQLATFPFTLRVAANPAAGQSVSNDYYQYSTMEAVSDAVDTFLAKAEEALQVVHDTATEDAPAIVCEAVGESITVNDAADRPLQGLSIYGRTVQKVTPTPENPAPMESAGAGGAVCVSVAGKNLCPVNSISTKESGAGRFIIPYLPTGDYFLSAVITKFSDDEATNTRVTVSPVYTDGTNGSYSSEWDRTNSERDGVARSKSVKFSISADKVLEYIQVIVLDYGSSTNRNAKAENIQIEIGNSVTAYEPYKGQTLTVSTPNGLHGIDSVKDEIDFTRGVKVKRILDITVDNASDLGYGTTSNGVPYLDILGSCNVINDTPALSNGYVWERRYPDASHGVMKNYGTCITVFDNRFTDKDTAVAILREMNFAALAKMETPIETPLSAQEMAAYAALHTGKPNTTVFNDGGAEMELAYVADTKTYIDNKLAAISKAML